MIGAGLFGVVFAVGIGVSLVLYGLVRSEHDSRRRMDRAEAERCARRDVDRE